MVHMLIWLLIKPKASSITFVTLNLLHMFISRTSRLLVIKNIQPTRKIISWDFLFTLKMILVGYFNYKLILWIVKLMLKIYKRSQTLYRRSQTLEEDSLKIYEGVWHQGSMSGGIATINIKKPSLSCKLSSCYFAMLFHSWNKY